ncbi:MAG: hypothetical protein KC733_10650 [Candidatus Omnitrophica bacterium]|nr:hypothetical protein [Candidatus Omnitrophota bacterium]
MKKNVLLIIGIIVLIGLIVFNYTIIQTPEIKVHNVVLDNFCNISFTASNKTYQTLVVKLRLSLYQLPSTGDPGGLTQVKTIDVSLKPKEIKVINESLSCPPMTNSTIGDVEVISISTKD